MVTEIYIYIYVKQSGVCVCVCGQFILFNMYTINIYTQTYYMDGPMSRSFDDICLLFIVNVHVCVVCVSGWDECVSGLAAHQHYHHHHHCDEYVSLVPQKLRWLRLAIVSVGSARNKMEKEETEKKGIAMGYTRSATD